LNNNGYNTAFGNGTLYNLTTGYRNCAIGYNSMYDCTDESYSTAIGHGSGQKNNGSKNTFLGSNADFDSDTSTWTNSTAIGYDARITASNQISLGTSTETVKIRGNLTVDGAVDISGLIVQKDATFNGVLKLNAGTLDANTTTPSAVVDAANRTNTYINFGMAGTTNDFALLRQIGGDNAFNLALDFYDDGSDAGFVIRDILNVGVNTDTITERFKVKRGGGVEIINGADATSITAGGSLTVSGGAAISQKLFVGGVTTFSSIPVCNGGNATLSTQLITKGAGDALYAPISGSTNYAPISGSANYAPATGSTNYAPISGSTNYAPISGSTNYAPISGSANYAPATGSANYAPATGSANYAPATNSTNYAPKASPTFTGTASFSVITASSTVSALSFNATSDYRMKKNVQALDSQTIDLINPVEYDLSGGKHDMGFLAHEVQEVFPFLVEGEKDGKEIQSLNYNGFIALLVKEVKVLKKENTTLKNQNTLFERRLQELEAIVLK
jgi:hypothetical protein